MPKTAETGEIALWLNMRVVKCNITCYKNKMGPIIRTSGPTFSHFYVLIHPGFSRLKYWYTVMVDLPTNTEILPIGIVPPRRWRY